MYGNCCGDGVFSGAAKAWKGSEAFSWLYACVSCLSVWSQDRMEFYVKVAGCLPLFPSSFLSFVFSLFIFLFFISLPFFHLSFFQASQGWHLLKTRILLWMAGTWSVTLCDFPHTWIFVWKSSVQCRGLLLSVFPLQRASKCSVDAALMFSGIICPLKWLGPRIPEGAYYA